MKQEEISKLGNGVIACRIQQVGYYMPEMFDILKTFPDNLSNYFFDIKVHMLMPNMWPCIPNWHCDFVPRDENKNLKPELIKDDVGPMFLWLSNSPLTEFKDGREVKPETWIPFTQRCEHRGTMSQEHCWRIFIRATPSEIIPQQIFKYSGLRRHSQVYLDKNFTW